MGKSPDRRVGVDRHTKHGGARQRFSDAAGNADHTRTDHLRKRAIELARLDPAFVGWVLAQYEADEGLSGKALAIQLKASDEKLYRLSLCLRPRPEFFAEDVHNIATHSGVFVDALVRIVRQVEVLGAIVPNSAGLERNTIQGILMAARVRPSAEGNQAVREEGTRQVASRRPGVESTRTSPSSQKSSRKSRTPKRKP